MSVVPFLPEGDSSTYVEVAEKFDLNGSKVLLRNADPEQIALFASKEENNRPSNVSYDLRVGGLYRDFSYGDLKTLNEGKIKIKPKMYVEILTEEKVAFPRTRCGSISSKVSKLKQGISVPPTNVDPGYDGHLVIWVYNFGTETVTLSKGEKFCALKVETIEGNAVLYSKPEKSVSGKERHGIRPVITWLNKYSIVISMLFNALMLLVAIMAIYFSSK